MLIISMPQKREGPHRSGAQHEERVMMKLVIILNDSIVISCQLTKTVRRREKIPSNPKLKYKVKNGPINYRNSVKE